MALTTVAEIVAFIGGVASSQTAFWAAILPGVEKSMQGFLGFNIEAQNYTESYNGTGTFELVLRNPFVNSIASVYVNSESNWNQNEAADAEHLLDPSAYFLRKDGPGNAYSRSGLLIRKGTIWDNSWIQKRGTLTTLFQQGQGNILVTYNAGFDPVPQDIKLAVWECCAMVRALRKFGDPVDSSGYEGFSYHLNMETPTSVFEQSKMQKIGSVQQVMADYKGATTRIG